MEFDVPQKTNIDGLTWSPKRIVVDERGAVLLMLKDGQFEFPVGEIYFSLVKPDVIKGWKLHSEMWQRFAVPSGVIKFVFVDQRPLSPTKGAIYECECGSENYGVLTVPPGLWYSFRSKSDGPSIIANAASIPRRVGESDSMDVAAFPHYKWQ